MGEGIPEKRSLSQPQKFAEADHYRDRFKSEADTENRSLKVRLGLQKPVSESSRAQIVAERDVRDFERRLSIEYEKQDVGFRKVRDHLLQQRDMPEGSFEPDTLIVFMGGAQYGAYCAGQAVGLYEVGITPRLFKGILGMSAGSGPAALYAAGRDQASLAGGYFVDDCTSKEFLNPARPLKIIDTSVIARALRSGPKALNEGLVRACPADVIVMARNQQTRETEYIDLKTVTPDMVTGLEASSAISPFRKGVNVDGKILEDGGFNVVDLKTIISKFKPKNILFLPNVPFNFKDTLRYNDRERRFIRGISYLSDKQSINSIGTLEAFLTEKGRMRELVEQAEEEYGVTIGFAYPPDSGVETLTRDRKVVKTAVIESARDIIGRFGGKQPHRINFYGNDDRDAGADLQMAA